MGPVLYTYLTVKLYSDLFSVPANTISTNNTDQNKNITIRRCLSGHAHINSSVLKGMRNIEMCSSKDKTPFDSRAFWPVVFHGDGCGRHRKHVEIYLDCISMCTVLDQFVDSD